MIQYGLPALEMSAEKEARQVGRVEKICQKHLRCYQICIPVDDQNSFMDTWNLTSNMSRALIHPSGSNGFDMI